MRKRKTVKIDDLEVTVYEVIIEDLLMTKLPESFDEIKDGLAGLLPKCTDLSIDKMKKMPPSDLKKVWDGFKEVNDVFFSLMEKL